jgi:malic enzyme
LSGVRSISDEIFLAAAQRLAALVPQHRLAVGAIYPEQSELRSVSAAIAETVVREVNRQGAGREVSAADIPALVKSAMWYPAYSAE